MRCLLYIITALLLSAYVVKAQVVISDINLENYTYPFPVKYLSLSLEKNKYQMAYMDAQPEKPNGRAVVLLHGKNFNGAYWKRTADSLLTKGFRVIMPDQLGFGKSSKPATFQYSFQQLAQNTKALLDTLGITQTIVLGHSMGGMLAVRFTLMYPETVTQLVLEDPIGLEDYALKIPYQSVDQWYQRELKQTYNSMKKYQKTNYYQNEWKPEYEPWLKMTAGWTNNIKYSLIAWCSALTYDMIMTQPVVYELKHLNTPTLLIIGLNDKTALGKELVSMEVQQSMGNYAVLGKETAHKIKGSVLIELDNTGHLPHIQSFEKFITPLLSFIQK